MKKTIFLICRICKYSIRIEEKKMKQMDMYCPKCNSFMSEPDLFDND